MDDGENDSPSKITNPKMEPDNNENEAVNGQLEDSHQNTDVEDHDELYTTMINLEKENYEDSAPSSSREFDLINEDSEEDYDHNAIDESHAEPTDYESKIAPREKNIDESNLDTSMFPSFENIHNVSMLIREQELNRDCTNAQSEAHSELQSNEEIIGEEIQKEQTQEEIPMIEEQEQQITPQVEEEEQEEETQEIAPRIEEDDEQEDFAIENADVSSTKNAGDEDEYSQQNTTMQYNRAVDDEVVAMIDLRLSKDKLLADTQQIKEHDEEVKDIQNEAVVLPSEVVGEISLDGGSPVHRSILNASQKQELWEDQIIASYSEEKEEEQDAFNSQIVLNENMLEENQPFDIQEEEVDKESLNRLAQEEPEDKGTIAKEILGEDSTNALYQINLQSKQNKKSDSPDNYIDHRKQSSDEDALGMRVELNGSFPEDPNENNEEEILINDIAKDYGLHEGISQFEVLQDIHPENNDIKISGEEMFEERPKQESINNPEKSTKSLTNPDSLSFEELDESRNYGLVEEDSIEERKEGEEAKEVSIEKRDGGEKVLENTSLAPDITEIKPEEDTALGMELEFEFSIIGESQFSAEKVDILKSQNFFTSFLSSEIRKFAFEKNNRVTDYKNYKFQVGYPKKHSNNNLTTFHTYPISTYNNREKEINRVSRRYKDFDWVFTALEYQFPGVFLPKLPPKNALTRLNLSNEEFLERRRRGLEKFISILLTIDKILPSDQLFHFLFSSDEYFGFFVEKEKKERVQVEDTGMMSRIGNYFDGYFNQDIKYD